MELLLNQANRLSDIKRRSKNPPSCKNLAHGNPHNNLKKLPYPMHKKLLQKLTILNPKRSHPLQRKTPHPRKPNNLLPLPLLIILRNRLHRCQKYPFILNFPKFNQNTQFEPTRGD